MRERRRYVLHVDLDPFFVSVERSLDPALRGRPVVIGGDGRGQGFVAAASEEARAAGVRVGLPLAQARQLCPAAAFRRGDLDSYGRASEEVTAVLLAASRRVERPSADEAFVDLSPPEHGQLHHAARPVPPVRAAETIRDELHRRLGFDASLGLASSRLAARIASGWAKPRGMLVVLPGYERSFVGPRPVGLLGLPPAVEAAFARAGITTLGQLAEAEPGVLAEAIGPAALPARAAARGEGEPEIGLAAPPPFLQEETTIRDRRGSDAVALALVAESLARRAARRLKSFRLGASAVTMEVRRVNDTARRATALALPSDDADALAAVARELATPLVEPAHAVRSLQLRLSRLRPMDTQAPLFPAAPAFRRAL